MSSIQLGLELHIPASPSSAYRIWRGSLSLSSSGGDVRAAGSHASVCSSLPGQLGTQVVGGSIHLLFQAEFSCNYTSSRVIGPVILDPSAVNLSRFRDA